MREIDAEHVAGGAELEAAKRLLLDMCERLENVTGLIISLLKAFDGTAGNVIELADFWFAPAGNTGPVSFSGQGPEIRCLLAPGRQRSVRSRRPQIARYVVSCAAEYFVPDRHDDAPVPSKVMTSRFQPGDHLQVRRPLFYNHHGVYISDDRIIQFGGGIWDKPRAAIGEVKLREFEKRGTARVVQHGRDSPFTGHHPGADAPWKRIARAEFLLRLQPKLRYNVIGYNCEHIANMCVVGNWPESYQVRRIFGAHAYATVAVMFWLSRRSRGRSPLSGRYRGCFLLSSLVALAAVGMYNRQIRKFWKEIGPQWQAHERVLADDPRNGQPE